MYVEKVLLVSPGQWLQKEAVSEQMRISVLAAGRVSLALFVLGVRAHRQAPGDSFRFSIIGICVVGLVIQGTYSTNTDMYTCVIHT